MLVAGIVHHQIEDKLHLALLDARQEFIEIGHGAKLGHDLAVVADVVAVIGVRRIVVRAQPDDVDPEPLNVVELRRNALQVADAIAIRILE